jgi:uncharacterized membrane protein
MESHAKLLGHPIHQMLIVFPLGLLATSNIFDAIAAATDNEKLSETGHTMMGAGVVSGLAAAVPGLIDFLAIPEDTRAKRIGLVHGIGNVVVTGLYAASWLLRRDNPRMPSRKAVGLAAAGGALALFTGWLGGELVDRLGVGVSDEAHLNAPNSLRSEREIAA